LALLKAEDAGVIVLDSDVPQTVIWPVAGGKGGTGKSTLTANLGVGLALLGYKVILVDGDLGGSDLHLFFDQIAPPRSLGNFLTGEFDSLQALMLATPSENLKLICGGNELVGMANLPHLSKEKLIRHIQGLDADYVLIDLGAGASFNTLDLFTLSDEGIVVCTPEPHARVDTYGFIKNTVYRKLRRRFHDREDVKESINQFARQAGRRTGRVRDLLTVLGRLDPDVGYEAHELLRAYRPKLILNRVRHKRHIEEVQRFQTLVKEYLSVEMHYVGHVRSDDRILNACERRRPVLIDAPRAAASRDIYNLLMGGLSVPDRLRRLSAEQYRKLSDLARAEAKYW
jgi:flagellar biosynthesis protein FlhG